MKQKTLKYFGIFLLFMMICTVVSRGIYSTRMPKIETGNAARKGISHTVEAEGSLSGGTERPIVAEPGLLVGEICVMEGQKIDKDTVLMKYDMDYLKKLVEETKKEAEIESAKAKDMENSRQLQKEKRDREAKRAEEDARAAGEQKDAAIGTAQQEYDAANAALAEYPSLKDYIKEQKKQDKEYEKLKKEAQKEDSPKEAKQAFEEYEKNLEDLAKKDWESMKQSLQESLSEKEKALAETNAATNEKLQSANRALSDALAGEEENQGTLLEQDKAKESKQQLYERILAIYESGGEVKSTTEGYIKSILAVVGAKTTEEAAFLFTEVTGDFSFTAIITKEQKTYADVGDKAEVVFEGDRKVFSDVKVASIQQMEEEGYEVTVKIPSEDMVLGARGKLKIEDEGEQYNCCVPLSALFADSNQTYVLVVQEKETILGTELSVRRVDVEIEEKNQQYAALVGEPLTKEDKIVTAADREIHSGQVVRISEN